MESDPEYIAQLVASVDRAVPALQAITPADAARRSRPDKWCAAEIIGHLIDSATVNHERFVRAAFRDDLLFPGYDQDAWVALQCPAARPWQDLIALWAHLNHHIAHLMSSIPAGVRERPHTVHNLHQIAWQPVPVDQPTTLDYLMSDYVVHLRHHLSQMQIGT